MFANKNKIELFTKNIYENSIDNDKKKYNHQSQNTIVNMWEFNKTQQDLIYFLLENNSAYNFFDLVIAFFEIEKLVFMDNTIWFFSINDEQKYHFIRHWNSFATNVNFLIKKRILKKQNFFPVENWEMQFEVSKYLNLRKTHLKSGVHLNNEHKDFFKKENKLIQDKNTVNK